MEVEKAARCRDKMEKKKKVKVKVNVDDNGHVEDARHGHFRQRQ